MIEKMQCHFCRHKKQAPVIPAFYGIFSVLFSQITRNSRKKIAASLTSYCMTLKQSSLHGPSPYPSPKISSSSL